jgi:hypothetical protein
MLGQPFRLEDGNHEEKSNRERGLAPENEIL